MAIIVPGAGNSAQLLAGNRVLSTTGNEVGDTVNYVTTGDFESGITTGWATYADAAATTPVDGTGGTAGITFAASAVTPLRGTYSGLLTKDAANRQGNGVAFAFTIDRTDRGKPLQIQFDFEALSGTYAAGDVAVFLYDVTNSLLIATSTVNVPGGAGTFNASFLTTTSTSYRLILHVASTSASAYSLGLDNFRVGPFETLLGLAGHGFLPYTPTFQGFGTPIGIDFWYRRSGDTLQVIGGFVSGTPSAVEARVGFPPGLTASNTVFGAGSKVQGRAYRQVNTAGTRKAVVPVFSSSFAYCRFGNDDYSVAEFPVNVINGNSLVNAGESFYVEFQVPVNEWSSNVQMLNLQYTEAASNSNATSTASDTTSFVYGYAGSLVPQPTIGTAATRRVRYQTAIQPTDSFTIELKTPSGTYFPVETFGAPYVRQGSSEYGISVLYVNSTDVDVVFNAQGIIPSNATYAGNGAAWSAYSSNSWRLRKTSALAAGAGPISARNLIGDISGTAVPTGYLGEKVDFDFLSPAMPASGTIVNVWSKILQPGRWLITAGVGIFAGSAGVVAATDNYALVSISTNSATEDALRRGAGNLAPANCGGERGFTVTSVLDLAVATPVYVTIRHGYTTVGNSSISTNFAQRTFALRVG